MPERAAAEPRLEGRREGGGGRRRQQRGGRGAAGGRGVGGGGGGMSRSGGAVGRDGWEADEQLALRYRQELI